ncbi:DUF4150 domain-containing protein [Pseudomonas sp. SCB32]|uniref:DUF4150 domain-containing protein n=1 Tax=Pseudomonas sp. SCB32 TaxID=2653853 RepID=UPI001264F2C5|nr:DUF4150 domain-containing protein [Pseudomonas sp. SCB32]
MFANSQVGGIDIANPDVCLTPPVPVPVSYVNVAAGSTAIPNVPNVLLIGGPAHNMGTVVPQTNGDNPGVAGGVASGTVMAPSRHITGAFTVILHGMPVTRMTSMTQQNTTNAIGSRVAPSQGKVLVLAG